MSFPYELLDDPARLAGYQGWGEEVYRDFLRLQRGEMSPEEFGEKYHWQRAILNMDMTGFTASAMREGELESLLRIFDAQKVCLPVLEEHGAGLVRCFADDIVALFELTDAALDAALEIHRRVEFFNDSPLASRHPTRCCAGETLLTERARAALAHRDDVAFEQQDQDDQLFPFYRAVPPGR